MKKWLLISLLGSAMLLAGVKAGDPFPRITLPDQFGKSLSVSRDDRFVLIAFEKDVAIGIADDLKARPKGYLKKHHIKYISDISSMPSFITSMFALPKMKQYPFSVMLIRDGSGKGYEREKGKATLYRLKGGRVTAVDFIAPGDLGRATGAP